MIRRIRRAAVAPTMGAPCHCPAACPRRSPRGWGAGRTSCRCSSPSSSSGSASGRCCRSCPSTSGSTASTSRRSASSSPRGPRRASSANRSSAGWPIGSRGCRSWSPATLGPGSSSSCRSSSSGRRPFLVLRALQGLSTAVYDPAARGYITDATPPERRGEAFGLYGAAQMGGLVFGPAIGGLGSALVRRDRFRLHLRRDQLVRRGTRDRAAGPRVSRARAGIARAPRSTRRSSPARPTLVHGADEPAALRPGAGPTRMGLLNRLLIAAILVNIGGNFAAGTYDVVWSIFLEGSAPGSSSSA